MKEGYKITELGEIPEEWEVKKIMDFAKVVTGSTPPTINSESYGGPYPWVTPSDIGNNKYIFNTTRTLSTIGIEIGRRLPANSLLITCIASIGKNAILKRDGSCNQQINAIVPSGSHDTDYLYYNFENNKKRLHRISAATAVPIINKSTFNNFLLVLPPLPEQQKIASILRTVDEKIEVIGEQISQTQELKKGLMQQLLTKGIGHTKFKSSELGEIPESWEVVSLRDVLKDMKSGLSRKLSIHDIGLPVIRSNNLDNEEVTFEEIKYWYLDDPQGANTKDYFLRDGDILISFINSRAQIGKSAMFFDKIKRPAIYTTNILKLTVKENISRRFIYYCTKTAQYDNFVQLITKPAVNQASFTTKDFKRYKISLPEFEEQQKIATILSATDEKIDILKSKKQTYQQLKKGLMQQLLTGKVRVKFHQQETSLA